MNVFNSPSTLRGKSYFQSPLAKTFSPSSIHVSDPVYFKAPKNETLKRGLYFTLHGRRFQSTKRLFPKVITIKISGSATFLCR